MKHYLEQAEDVLREVGSCQQGLSTGEAEARLAKNGRNKLAEAKKDSLIKRFFQQMADPMIIILLVAAAIDAFGLLGSEKVPFVWSKWLGLGMMIAGVLLFKWEGTQGAG